MILSGIKALYRAAGVPAPPGLGRRVSAVATPEQLAALLAEVWPKTTAKPSSAAKLEEALLEGLLAPVPGRAELMTAKERKVAEQFAGNRYVGIHIALGHGREGEAADVRRRSSREGPPIGRRSRRTDLLEEVDGVDTKGMELREVVERLRGEEGTDVTIKVRQPKETKSRTIKITRGRASDRLMHPTVEGIRKRRRRATGMSGSTVPDPIGYLKITGIGASTPHELRKLAQQMESEGVRALVLDLRGAGSAGRTCGAPGRPAGRQPAGAGSDRAGPHGPGRDDLPGRLRRPVPRLADGGARRPQHGGHGGVARGGPPG